MLSDKGSVTARAVIYDDIHGCPLFKPCSHNIYRLFDHGGLQHAIGKSIERICPRVGILVANTYRCHQSEDALIPGIEETVAGLCKLLFERWKPCSVREYLTNPMLFQDIEERVYQVGFRAKLMECDEINSRNFDTLIEFIAGNGHDDVIIDNGSSTFVPLSHYLISNEVGELLNTMGHELVIHTVVTGGQALLDTINGFSHLVSQFPEPALFTVWLNQYWGPIEHEKRGFEEFKAYQDNRARVSAIVTIPQLKQETFGRDLSDMLQERLTFDEALQMDSLTIMTRQRLKIFKNKLFEQMDGAMVL